MKKHLVIFVVVLSLVGICVGLLIQSGRLHSPYSGQISSLSLLNKLDKNFPGSGPVEETADQFKVQIQNWQVLFSKNKDLDMQISALQEMANNLRIDRAKNLVIDLRFNKAIIRNNEQR